MLNYGSFYIGVRLTDGNRFNWTDRWGRSQLTDSLASSESRHHLELGAMVSSRIGLPHISWMERGQETRGFAYSIKGKEMSVAVAVSRSRLQTSTVKTTVRVSCCWSNGPMKESFKQYRHWRVSDQTAKNVPSLPRPRRVYNPIRLMVPQRDWQKIDQ